MPGLTRYPFLTWWLKEDQGGSRIMLCISGMTFEFTQMSLLFSSWMRFIVNLCQVLEIQVGVDLRG